MDAARVAFASAAKLLPAVADDLLDGTNLELLDEIIAARPRSGVPGLDYATTERWFASREGIWFATDSELPRSMATYLERSRSEDPADRAVAALKLPIAPRVTNNARDDEAGFARLLELLDDPDPDVRRAAASGLGQWRAIEALGPILALLETETGDRSSPFAAAATFIAFDRSDEQRREVVRALEVFASRGDAAAAQVKELAWRIDGSPKARYPRSTELWS
jgi:HEAT repeat protein